MIYYVNTDGSIIGGTQSDDLNGITALHSAAYAVYIDDATVNSVTNNGTAQGTLSIAGLTPTSPYPVNLYGIPTATGTLTFTATPTATLLANAQQAKIASLEQSYLGAVQTFQSSALGTTHTYKAGLTDMILLGNEYSFVTGPDYDNNPINWYTIETDSEVAHTAAQFRQVWKDGRTYVQSQDAHKANLKAQVNAATTVAAVNAITW